ncbi:MAG: NAD(P)H-hydrate dehydratase [Verrucomicrobiae bacterium]|nr:NAD(P)H-hydrate dehydratase [Verrucomicrobiae bacterium]
MKIVTASQMRELDRRTQRERGISERTLIARAGRATAEWIAAHYSKGTRILALVGKGNNGADALVACRCLAKLGFPTRAFRAWRPGEARAFLIEAARPMRPGERPRIALDGLFGTGLDRPLEGRFLSLAAALGEPALEVISLDLPSGLHPDTGRPLGAAARARHTLAFGLPKFGLVQEHAAEHVGELHVLDLGFPADLVEKIPSAYELLAPEGLASFFAPRKRLSHKGDFGRVVVIGGSVGLAGAPALAARAALRAGAGLVHLLVPKALSPGVLPLAGAEVMTTPLEDGGKGFFTERAFSKAREFLRTAQSVVLGPGLGRAAATQAFVEAILGSCSVPLVLDADALNLFARRTNRLRAPCGERIFTPHPGEMGRLVGAAVAEVQRDRFGVAGAFARKHGVTVVLKGARTLVAHPRAVFVRASTAEGGGMRSVRFSVNAQAGNPGMATGGSGDVLSGILAALLARGLSAADAARAGVWLHARAGDLALPPTGGGTAGDLIEVLPRAMERAVSSTQLLSR